MRPVAAAYPAARTFAPRKSSGGANSLVSGTANSSPPVQRFFWGPARPKVGIPWTVALTSPFFRFPRQPEADDRRRATIESSVIIVTGLLRKARSGGVFFSAAVVGLLERGYAGKMNGGIVASAWYAAAFGKEYHLPAGPVGGLPRRRGRFDGNAGYAPGPSALFAIDGPQRLARIVAPGASTRLVCRFQMSSGPRHMLKRWLASSWSMIRASRALPPSSRTSSTSCRY